MNSCVGLGAIGRKGAYGWDKLDHDAAPKSLSGAQNAVMTAASMPY